MNAFVPDKDQKKVIDIINERAIVFAAPGCGKTEILSRRIIQAHEEFGVPYEKMLCLTFTNRASREMKDRIKENTQEPTAALFVGNIHRFCIRFLIDNDLIPLDASIIDDQDQIDILNELSEGTFNEPLKSHLVQYITRKGILLFQHEHNHLQSTILYDESTLDKNLNQYRSGHLKQPLDEIVCKYKAYKPQIRNYAPKMIQKRKESASLLKGGTVHRMSP